jgi:hypothetical protein
VINRELIGLLAQSLYLSAEPSNANDSHTRNPHATDSYLKCNAKSALTGLSSAESTDNMRTFFLFITKAYISLHDNALASAKFRRNGRSEEEAREGGSNRRQNLGIFDQNLAIFGMWKGSGPTFHLNRDKYTSYGNWTAPKPFVSFYALSPAVTPTVPRLPSSPEERSLLNERNWDPDQSAQAGNETGGPSEVHSALSDSTTYRFHFLVNVSKCLILSDLSALPRSFFKKTKALNLAAGREFEGVSFLNISSKEVDHTQGLTRTEVTAPKL